eukprot:scaffold15506_cov88-Isochrysis_galbana.AAC.2
MCSRRGGGGGGGGGRWLTSSSEDLDLRLESFPLRRQCRIRLAQGGNTGRFRFGGERREGKELTATAGGGPKGKSRKVAGRGKRVDPKYVHVPHLARRRMWRRMWR